MGGTDKTLIWVHGEIKTPPMSRAARTEAGFFLRQLQRGEIPPMPHSRPMPTIGPRCHELRIPDDGVTWRGDLPNGYRCNRDSGGLPENYPRDPAGRHRCLPAADIRLRLEQQVRVPMDKAKQEKLEQAGWKVGSVEEFLGLTAEESAYIELRLRLSEELRRLRVARQMTQAQVARMIASSQSRVAKAEAADQSVSLDLLIRSLLAMGASDRDLARAIEGRAPHAAAV